MAERAVVTLKTLHCLKQDDETGSGSEPYIWPFLAGFALGPLDFLTTPKPGVIGTAPKALLGNELAPGQSLTLQPPFNTLTIDFKPGQSDLQLVLIVALLENDGTNAVEIASGQAAFLHNLNHQAARYVELLGTDPDDAIPLALEIADGAQADALAAIKFTAAEKAFNRRDDLLAIAVRGFRKPLQHGLRNFVLTFDSPGNRFTLDGTLNLFTPRQTPGHVPTGDNAPAPG